MAGEEKKGLELFSLAGKIAILVGASGRYGRQIARALIQAGATAYLTTRNREKLQELKSSFAQDEICAEVVYMDQSVEQSVIDLRELVLARHGRIDILINNAVARPMKDWNDDTANFAESMSVNAVGLYTLTKIVGNAMERQKSGSIINIGSIQGMVGPDASLYEGMAFHGFVPDYFFHKGGMINFTKFAAAYYGKHNIRCNCISPGGFLTEAHPDEFVRRYGDRTFLGRMANGSDLMGAIVFFASDASLYVTGTNLPVDGGYTAK